MISIIIPNWNGQKFLEKCLSSIFSQSYKNFEVIFVDDASSDDSVEYVRSKFPKVRIIEKKKNSGFPSSVNLGINKARGDFIALLNNDTEVDKKWLTAIFEASQRHPEVGFFASKMLDFADRSIIDSCGDGMTWAGRSYKIGELEKDSEKFSEEKYVFGACAGAAVYNKKIFDEVGLFDEDFGFYLEDIDVDFRAQLAGFKCLFVPDAKVYHIGSATAGKNSPFSYKMMIKNHFHVIYKNFPDDQIEINFIKILHSELRFFGAAIKHGFVGEYFWGVKEAWKQRGLMKKKREKMQEKIVVSLEYLNTIIDENFRYNSIIKAIKK